jgi:hypothetical protein
MTELTICEVVPSYIIYSLLSGQEKPKCTRFVPLPTTVPSAIEVGDL